MANDGTGYPRTSGAPTGHLNDRETVSRTELPASGSTAKNALQSWWSDNISVTITHDPRRHNTDPRDYLALERTYLAHVRTASVLAAFGITLVQLFILRNMNPTTGRVLGALCAAGGIVHVLVGCLCYFRQQKRLSHGIATAGGIGVWFGWTLFTSILVAIFVVVLFEN
ncbi:MAG: hypothetical protein Q9196_000901 [Gyalolechia fulgens]